ncbi:metallophosphoesterase family protein [Alkalicoccus daliensis]|uniref:Phosphoesterase n=1 Tax=Alkalicoccus daliensis TaxID=745820 RepID=A0A1H0CII4_9BACI|nr:metallophosphoesterase [Alkalicoccus daliensis]SDN57684.1 hypothetical protein SAMN04488053_102114 [Alkalicoccus daliensis]
MLKVLIMSDSHGWREEVAEVIHRHADEAAGIIHCGDSELQADAEVFEETQVVRGNCDMDGALPEEIKKKFGSLTFFVAHGHLLNVKTTAMNLLYKAEETEADIVCFGHTHVPAAVQEKGKILINPGSMRLPREYPEGTYVLLEHSENVVRVNFYDMKGNQVEELSKTFSV